MKNMNLVCTRLFIFAALLFLIQTSSAQLSGNYTINPWQSASSTNYTNWASAVGDLVSGSRTDGGTAQGPGVSGTVVITVSDTVYGVQVEIGAISGTSSSNTVTFKSNGGDSTLCVLRYASGSASNTDYVLSMNGCDYVTFQGIGFERTGTNTYSTVVQLLSNATYNHFTHCRMVGRKMPSNSSLGFQYGPSSCIYITGNADYTEISNCEILYGYNGVYSVQSGSGIKIHDNQFDTSGSSGIYMTSQSGLEITSNTFYMGDFGPNQGHYTSYGFRIESSPGMRITKNKVFMTAVNAQVCRAAVVANTTSSSSAPARVNNNWLMNGGGTGDCTGLAVYGCSYLDFYYNNLLITNSLSAGACYYHYANYTNSNINLVNNNFINKGGGYAVSVPGSNTTDLVLVNHNNLYSSGSYLGKWSGSDYSTFSAWKSATSKDSNSVSIDPGYTGSLDLHVSNIGINGKASTYSSVTDDIDGDTRDSVSPDIGADEFFPAANDAGISSIDSPIVFCAGTHPIKVSFTNYGTDTLKSLTIDWQVNGTNQTSYSWSGTVAPGATSASVSLGSQSFSSNTAYSIKVWTKNPNGSSDGNTQNDTIMRVRYAGLSGTYSIGDTSVSDYKSFNDAITAMTSRGICGAVTFNVYPGVYTEQITLVQLPGMGSSSPVTFQNMNTDSTTVLITLPSTTATGNNNAAIQLRGADYVTFKHITFERTGTNSNALVLHILNESNHNTFQGCQMRGIVSTSANANANNIYSDQSADHYNSFIGNYVVHGTVCMSYTGTSTEDEIGTVVEGNRFDSAFSNLVQISYNSGITVKGNSFGRISYTATGSFDVQLNFCDSNLRVLGNYFSASNTNIALHLVGCDASSNYTGIIANNFITKDYGKGIVLDGVQYQKVYYNNLNFTQSDTGNVGILVSYAGSSGIEFKNNSIAMLGGRMFNVDGSAQISSSNYNNLYTTGSGFALWDGTAYSNLSGFKATGNDSNSISANPVYYSSVNLHVKSPALKGMGSAISSVTTDIDGQTRSNSAPDIGADEFDLLPNDAGIIALISPADKDCSGLSPVKTVLKNFGKDTLKSVDIEWFVNGTAQTTYNWTGALITNSVDTVTLDPAYSLTGGSIVFSARTNSPNGQTDEIGYNDSTRVSLQIFNSPVKNAGPDKILCLGDSLLIGGSNLSGFAFEWSDMTGNILGTSPQIYINTSSNASYQVKVINNSTGCTSLDTMNVSVMPKPTLNAGPDRVLCSGQSTTISDPTAQTGYGYQWSSIPSGFSSLNSQISVSPNYTTSYLLQKTNTISGCSIVDTVLVTVIQKHSISISGTSNVCSSDTFTFSATNISGSSYLWNTQGATIVNGQNSSQIDARWSTPGTYNLSVIVTGSQGCADTGSKFLNVMLKPLAQMQIDGSCTGRQISFEDQSTPNSNRTWYFGDGGSSLLATTTHSYTQAGTYTVLLISKSGSCVDTASQSLQVVDPPKANFTNGPACVNALTSFSDSSTNATSWTWTIDGATSVGQIISHTFSATGNYSVKLLATGTTGCADSISRYITVHAQPSADYSYQVFGDTLALIPGDTNGTHYWDFGDGQYSNDKFATHRYAQIPAHVLISHTLTSIYGCSQSKSDSIWVGPNGLSSAVGDLTFSVYPNPFRKELFIDLNLVQAGRVKIHLYDASGKELILHEAGYQEAGNVRLNLNTDTPNLVPGVYLIVVEMDGLRGSQRLVKTE
ncbi:MAG: PKD domain-containing protein [Bacteroidetes bacterium]|nr:PKD domain-containing protein [Bacteroidota bacterium]